MTEAFLVWRTPYRWEDDHTHLDSVHLVQADAIARARKFSVIAERYKPTAWVGKVTIGEPLDKSVTGNI